MKKSILIFICTLMVISSQTKAQTGFDPDFYLFEWHLDEAGHFYSAGSDFVSSPGSGLNYIDHFVLVPYAVQGERDGLIDGFSDQPGFYSKMENYVTMSPGIRDVFGMEGLSLRFGLRNNFYQYLNTTKELATVFMKGNSHTAGTTIPLSPNSYQALAWQEAEFKLVHFLPGADWSWGAGISLIKPSLFYELQIRDGSLFTSESGDSLHADFDLSFSRSNPDNSKLFSANGFGLSLNAFVSYKLSESSNIYFAADRLGFLTWNDASIEFDYQASEAFTGFGLLKDEPGGEGLFIDTFNNLDTENLRDKRKMVLSPRFSLVYLTQNPDNILNYEAGVYYQAIEGLLPRAWFQVKYHLNEDLYLKPGVTFDQFSNIGLNLQVGMRLIDKTYLNIGSSHLEGFGLIKNNGRQLYFNLMTVLD